jgi:hypothetical protein
MAIDREAHRHPVPLPEPRAALDVGELEGDGAGAEIGHSHPQFALSTETTVRKTPIIGDRVHGRGTDRSKAVSASRTGAVRHQQINSHCDNGHCPLPKSRKNVRMLQ